jgi:hypothetical protein
MDCFVALLLAMTRKSGYHANQKARPAMPDALVLLAHLRRAQIEYLNSGIAFSSSLVALNTA